LSRLLIRNPPNGSKYMERDKWKGIIIDVTERS